MKIRVIISIIAFYGVLEGVVGVPLKLSQENSSPNNIPLHLRFAKFTNPKGEDVFVDLYAQNYVLGEYIIDPEKVRFELYTKKDIDFPIRVFVNDSDGLIKSGFNPNIKTKFLVHGFMNDLNSDTIQVTKNNFLNISFEDYNVIAVDWSVYTLVYLKVDEKAESVGKLIGKFMDFLVTAVGVSPDDIHCVGHSLGAHACGFAGSSMKSGTIGRITGLDPALPGFTITSTAHRLDSRDAKFVDCIHTCGGFLGIDEPICSADFYPNSGKNQPGCHWFDFGSCSHGRSHEFFAESILDGHLFPSHSCDSLNFTPDHCQFQGALMGYPASDKFTGIFYTQTNDEFPFAKNWTNFG